MRAADRGRGTAGRSGDRLRTAWRTLRHWHEDAAEDPRRDERAAAWLGVALGVSFTTCFLTGLYSHLAQHPPAWFSLPARPAGLYRLTQGIHVATGIASVPLLLAKLWAVYPHLFRWPPVRTVADAVERLSLVPLVAGSLFMLYSGVANIELWYPLPAFFPTAHYWVAWLTIGAIVAHVGAKATVVTRALPGPHPPDTGRRRFLTGVAGASGVLTLVTVGQTVAPLRRLALLAPRDPATGPQGFPVNGAAREAGVADAAADPAWRLRVRGGPTELVLSRAELATMPQRRADLPIACVEGWSATCRWQGVPLGELLRRAGAPEGSRATVRSIERGLYARSEVDAAQAWDPDTLIALEVNGEPLHLDHGYPARLIGPNRPGVLQTKWLAEIEVHLP